MVIRFAVQYTVLALLSIVVMYRYNVIQVSVASSRNRVRWCRKELIAIECDFSF
jgi:hypothetical protein